MGGEKLVTEQSTCPHRWRARGRGDGQRNSYLLAGRSMAARACFSSCRIWAAAGRGSGGGRDNASRRAHTCVLAGECVLIHRHRGGAAIRGASEADGTWPRRALRVCRNEHSAGERSRFCGQKNAWVGVAASPAKSWRHIKYNTHPQQLLMPVRTCNYCFVECSLLLTTANSRDRHQRNVTIN